MSKLNYYVVGELGNDGEVTPLTMELAGLCNELSLQSGGKVIVFLFGEKAKNAAQSLADLGLDVLVFPDNTLADYNPELYLSLLKVFLAREDKYTVMAGHTALGQDIIPRLSFELDGACITDCIAVFFDERLKTNLFKRYLFGGNALVTQRSKGKGSFITVRARVGASIKESAGKGKVEVMDSISLPIPKVKVTGRELAHKELELEDAPVIIAGGRGMGGKDGFVRLEELALLLKGAVGASRPPVDSGWTDTTSQIGITGKVVAPNLYIAVGLSGSSQHLSGMSESGVIVAINKDKDAYIFKVADYGVAGDWQSVIPAFQQRISELA